ncbi:MAG: hypothetical protein HYV63_01925 [Candidatus Schekmanbacteria bacterium]|nr:hypothetical protein [Candidatus Schekmanbacteria bacterium]
MTAPGTAREHRVVITGVGAGCQLARGAAAVSRAICGTAPTGSDLLGLLTGQHCPEDLSRQHRAGSVPLAAGIELPAIVWLALVEALGDARSGWHSVTKYATTGRLARDEPDPADVRPLSAATGGLWIGTTLGLWPLFETLAPPSRADDAPDLYSGVTHAIAAELQVQGPVRTVSMACISGSVALGMAAEAIRSGSVEWAIAGAYDFRSQLARSGFKALRSLASEAPRPYSARSNGMGLGDGCAFLVLESAASAGRRGVRAHAEVCGFSWRQHSPHPIRPDSSGETLLKVLAESLAEAGSGPEFIDCVVGHGTGANAVDAMEMTALAKLFGDAETFLGRLRQGALSFTSLKHLLGHSFSASQLVELAALLSLVDRRQPVPTLPLTLEGNRVVACDGAASHPSDGARASDDRRWLAPAIALGSACTAFVLESPAKPADTAAVGGCSRAAPVDRWRRDGAWIPAGAATAFTLVREAATGEAPGASPPRLRSGDAVAEALTRAYEALREALPPDGTIAWSVGIPRGALAALRAYWTQLGSGRVPPALGFPYTSCAGVLTAAAVSAATTGPALALVGEIPSLDPVVEAVALLRAGRADAVLAGLVTQDETGAEVRAWFLAMTATSFAAAPSSNLGPRGLLVHHARAGTARGRMATDSTTPSPPTSSLPASEGGNEGRSCRGDAEQAIVSEEATAPTIRRWERENNPLALSYLVDLILQFSPSGSGELGLRKTPGQGILISETSDGRYAGISFALRGAELLTAGQSFARQADARSTAT